RAARRCTGTSSTSKPSSRRPGASERKFFPCLLCNTKFSSIHMHVAIIMDGNGRWATQRGLPRPLGHIEGAKSVRPTVEAAARAGVETLSLYAFSAANWERPRDEVEGLMFLLRRYLFTETRRCMDESIRINVIGRRDRLDESLLRAI